MLTIRDIETIRAALLYWQQEMAPHNESTWGSYLEADIQPLNTDEIEELRNNMASRVRFAQFDIRTGRLATTDLWELPDEVPVKAANVAVATVLLPAAN